MSGKNVSWENLQILLLQICNIMRRKIEFPQKCSTHDYFINYTILKIMKLIKCQCLHADI